MVGQSPEFLRTLEQLKLAAAADAPVLLEGETGTGKDLAAKFIHQHSDRRDKPFLTLDCTVLTESLFEAEVFGHERGAFTGSVGDKEGLFELVDGGTLFLDEIGELPAQLQAKLLRVLETGEYRRVGGRKTLHTNARIICATNRNLGSDVESKTFREDLYYRVACLHVRVPALRERLQDIPLIADVLLDRISASIGQKYLLSPEAVFQLQAYQYPGNIRELRNILSVAAAHCTGITIDAKDIVTVISCMKSRRWTDCEPDNDKLTDTVRESSSGEDPETLCTLEDLESQHIAELLKQCHGNRRQAAAALGVSERTMYRKLKRYGLG
jgi:transcriptional regulator with GAF, ATPase, and Fis domain